MCLVYFFLHLCGNKKGREGVDNEYGLNCLLTTHPAFRNNETLMICYPHVRPARDHIGRP